MNSIMANMKIKILILLLPIFSSATSLEIPENYNVATRPNQGAVADVINVSVELLGIRGFSEVNSDMIVDISMHTSWLDSRLIESVSRETMFTGKLPDIWLPDVQIANADSSSSDNWSALKVLRVRESGVVQLSQKLTTKIGCPVSLAKYPFDRQVCRLQLSSYGYTSLHLVLVWHGTVSENVITYHPEFSFSYAEQLEEKVNTPNGQYSNLILEIAVARCPLRVIFRAFLPSLFLVLLSYYVTFCHCVLLRNKATANGVNHVEATVIAPSSVILSSLPSGFNLLIIAINGMTLLVTVLVAQMNFMESPKSSAVTGLDVWLNFITATIFLMFWHSIQMHFGELHKTFDMTSKTMTDGCYVSKTHNILKMGIPVVLIVFTVAYFGTYLS